MNGFGFIEYEDAIDARDVVPGNALPDPPHPDRMATDIAQPFVCLLLDPAPSLTVVLTLSKMEPNSKAKGSPSNSHAVLDTRRITRAAPSAIPLPVLVAPSTACRSPGCNRTRVGRLAHSTYLLWFPWPRIQCWRPANGLTTFCDLSSTLVEALFLVWCCHGGPARVVAPPPMEQLSRVCVLPPYSSMALDGRQGTGLDFDEDDGSAAALRPGLTRP